MPPQIRNTLGYLSFLTEKYITTSFWETWWFQIGIIIIIIVALTLVFIWQYRRLSRREKQLDLERAERANRLDFIQAQMDILFNNSPLGIGLAALDGKIMSVNPAMATIFGYSNEEIQDVYVQDFFQSDEQRADILQRLEEEKIVQVNQLPLTRKDGSTVLINLTESRITTGDQEILLGIVQDITTQVKAEQVLKTETERAAVAAERERLARDLHDSVTQSMYTTSLMVEALPEVWETHPDEARQSLEEIRRINQGALAEMRTLLLELRPDAIADRPLGGLLRQLAEAVSARADLPIVTSTSGDCQMSTEVQVSFYRIAQEALNNITKHARATNVWINLNCSDDVVTMRIKDNGRGFDPEVVPPHKLGLSIMHARAKDINAELNITSQSNEGTQIQATWSKI